MIQVLILDDDEQVTRVLAAQLRRARQSQFTVTETVTRSAAFQAVRDASQVFDIFLIDQRLGPGPDGIEVMQELRRLSPETEAVIFTGMDDPNGGLRAYQAGAYRYLTKPIDKRELIWILQSLLEWRETRYERDWLRILTDVAEKTQRALPVADVAGLIVRGGQQLGFERTRLWAFDPVERSLTGISQAGSAGLEDFNGFAMPADHSPYLQRAFASRDPLFFHGRELGPGYLEGHFSQHGFEPQIGEWALLPLWIGERCLGMLVLDNASQPSQLRPSQRDLLRLFARQAAAALERAQQHEKTLRLGLADVTAQKQNRENELSILRHVLEQALTANTDELQVIKTLLNAAGRLLEQPTTHVRLALRAWARPDATHREPNEVWYDYRLGAEDALAKHALANLGDYQTPGEVDVSIRSGSEIIGIFHIKSSESNDLTRLHIDALERLAAAASLALDNVRRQKHLHTVLSAARAVTAPTDLEKTLQAIVTAIQDAVPNLSALTIWYRKPASEHIVLGPHFGIRHIDDMDHVVGPEGQMFIRGNVVWRVMQSDEPIWATRVEDNPRLAGRFIQSEAIVSTAAFGLRADDEVVGAMFFNYRQAHTFTDEEQALFPILAEIVAASIRDAARLEATRKERQRLEAALDITRAIGTTLDLDKALRKIMAKLVHLFPNVTPGVVTFNATEQELEFAPASAEFYKIDNPDYVDLKRITLDGPGLASYVARRSLSSKQVELVNDGHVTENPYYLNLLSNTCSELCVTLMSNKRLLGVLVLEHSERNGFDLDAVELVLNIAGQISLAIERANQSAQLRFSTTVAATTAWAAEIAHTINQEVSYIRNWVYWLAEEPGLSAEGRRYAEEIDQSAARLAGFSKAGPWHTKALELMNLEFFLKGWIRDAIENRDARVRIEFDLNCQTLYVRANPVALRRVVRHLVRNALEAMPFSGALMVRTRLVGERQLEVQIEDTGPGISDHLRRRLFQEPVSTKGDERGFGLLFVRFMVEDMGGAVRLMPPKPGKGANVAFTLPVASAEGEEIVDDAGNDL